MGYAGWGSSVPQLLEVTEAAERTRGFEPPVFVDVRFSRSVRAAGFRDRTFENTVPDHRYAVRGLLLEEAKKRRLAIEVAEWPGGEPRNAPVCTLKVSPKLMARLLGDASRIPIDRALAVSIFAAHPWGGYVEISDGARSAIAAVGPAKYSAGGWFIEPFVGPIEQGDQIDDLEKAARTIRKDANYGVFTVDYDFG